MAKKKVATRKTRLANGASAHHHPYSQPASPDSDPTSKAVSRTATSSPSPQPAQVDPPATTTPTSASSPLLLQGRKKSLPRRSPSQNDSTRGIVFSFRFQNDPAISMSVDILSYDQHANDNPRCLPGSGVIGHNSTTTTSTSSTTGMEKRLGIAAAADASQIPLEGSRANDILAPGSLTLSSTYRQQQHQEHRQQWMARRHWSCDLSSYRNNNVVDLNRNLLILHLRKPALRRACSTPVFASGTTTSTETTTTITTTTTTETTTTLTTAKVETVGVAVAPTSPRIARLTASPTSETPPPATHHHTPFPTATPRTNGGTGSERNGRAGSLRSSTPMLPASIPGQSPSSSSPISAPPTPALSASRSSSSSSSSSIPSSVPGSPEPFSSLATATVPSGMGTNGRASESLVQHNKNKDNNIDDDDDDDEPSLQQQQGPLPLSLDQLGSRHSTRILNVRGLGGAARGRRMQVILVS